MKWANDETVLIEESITRTINVDKKSTDEWQRWVAIDASGGDDRMMLMSGGEREWVTGATVLRAQAAETRQDLHGELGLAADDVPAGDR